MLATSLQEWEPHDDGASLCSSRVPMAQCPVSAECLVSDQCTNEYINEAECQPHDSAKLLFHIHIVFLKLSCSLLLHKHGERLLLSIRIVLFNSHRTLLPDAGSGAQAHSHQWGAHARCQTGGGCHMETLRSHLPAMDICSRTRTGPIFQAIRFLLGAFP